MVATCNAVGLAIYAMGLYLTARLAIVWGVLYAAYCLWMEGRLRSGSCRSCPYFGKRCGFGKGRVGSWFYSQSVERDRSTTPISGWNLVPEFLVPRIPFGVGSGSRGGPAGAAGQMKSIS